jgi:hypothetical protein
MGRHVYFFGEGRSSVIVRFNHFPCYYSVSSNNIALLIRKDFTMTLWFSYP